jgi:phosphoglycolate phosphatase-like HAD superfamily hydrolase
MKPTLVLFDIDGTLLRTDGVGRRAVNFAFETLHGRNDACDSFRFDGMTDFAIARKGLQAIGVTPTLEAMQALLDVYLERLRQELQAVDDGGCTVLPGIERALETAHERGLAVGLGTGNVREGARLKLSRVGLFRHFAFGGFGCDHEDRRELIRVGALRGAQLLKRPLDECRVVVVGDTPHDVAAALHLGAECIGVGTGAHAPEELLRAGATLAFQDFNEPLALEALWKR